MKRIIAFHHLMFGICLGAFLYTLFVWNLPEASAIPAFSRKYDMDCSHCHTAVPTLSEFGEKFNDNGFQMKGLEEELEDELRDLAAAEDPEETHPAYWPVSLRAIVGYEYHSKTHQDASGGDRTVSTSSFGVRRFYLLAAGLLTPGVSFYVNYTPDLDVEVGNVGFAGDPQKGELHQAWLRYTHRLNRGVMNAKLGLTNLDLVVRPLSHQRLTIAPYDILEYIPPSAVSAHIHSLASHQQGVELLSQHSKGLRYSFAVVNGQKGRTDDNKAVDFYARISQALKGQTLGLFGYWGQTSTEELTDSSGIPIPGTGRNNEPYYRYGADLDLRLGDLKLLSLYLYGQDDKDLFTGTDRQDAKYHGGFVEANFHVKPVDLMVVGRYDIIRNIHQGDKNLSKEEMNSDRITAALRHTILSTSRVVLIEFLDYSYKKSQRAGINDLDEVEHRITAAMNFAF